MMFDLLNRFGNYLSDGPFLQKRWIITSKKTDNLIAHEGLMVPGVRRAKSKYSDSNWRKNYNWVLLCSTGSVICYPIYSNRPDSRYGMKLLRPIRTRMFAMRVGEKPFWLVTINSEGKVSIPKFCSMFSGTPHEYTVMSKDDIEYISTVRGQEVTFI